MASLCVNTCAQEASVNCVGERVFASTVDAGTFVLPAAARASASIASSVLFVGIARARRFVRMAAARTCALPAAVPAFASTSNTDTGARSASWTANAYIGSSATHVRSAKCCESAGQKDWRGK
jgi:hypothetical protein